MEMVSFDGPGGGICPRDIRGKDQGEDGFLLWIKG